MKYYFFLFLIICITMGANSAYGHRHKYRSLPRTEVGLMSNVLGCLMNKDSLNYFYLFPPFDSLWAMVMHNPDRSPATIKALNELKEHPKTLLQFDPYYNKSIMKRFMNVLQKGEDSGIHWNTIVMQRYELVKESINTRDLAGYDIIAPERFKGYMFVRDLLGRLTFCITITEIQKIQGYFFGGQVINILEASTVDQYLAKEREERKYFEWLAKNPKNDSANADSIKMAKGDSLLATGDSTKKKKKLDLNVTNPTEDEKQQTRKEVIDRKYYEGKFDDEIPVKLFIRYLKDVKSGKTQLYDGLYKFGDQVNYVKLNITRDAEGKWVMEDDPPLGTLELELANKVYTGSWTNNESQTGYDVVMKQADITEKKMEQLDNILERGLYGKSDESAVSKKEGKDNDEKTPRIERLEKRIQREKKREKERAFELKQENEQQGQENKPKLKRRYDPED
jgi:hypothetical protein